MTTPFLRVTKGQPERVLPPLFAPELFALRGALPYSLTPQFLAADPDNFLRAVDMLGEIPQQVEINCGCPCPTCIGAYAGSGILAAPDVFGSTIERLSSALGSQRLAVKMRLGYACPTEFDRLLPHVAQLPLARLTIHGRTRKQGYSGVSCWHSVARASNAAKAPTWGSGDVIDLTSFRQARSTAPLAAGVMIGRGLLRNPWIFAELRNGIPVVVDDKTLGQALFVFALLSHLSIVAPQKLLSRVAQGRLPASCGIESDAWERLAADLSSLATGAPSVFTGKTQDTWPQLSPNVWPRLKYLWGYLRGSRSEAYQAPRLLRAKSTSAFFSSLSSITP